jgi:hypothetical protein
VQPGRHPYKAVLWDVALRLLASEAGSSFAENRFGIGSDCATHFPTAEHAIFTSELNPSDPFAYSKQMSFNFQPFQHAGICKSRHACSWSKGK